MWVGRLINEPRYYIIYKHNLCSIMVKEELKEKAIELRKKGKTYSEILKVIPVAKSTLSLWLREVGLSKPQKQIITEKRIMGQMRGAEAQRNKRIKKQNSIVNTALNEIKTISNRELWLIGIALYWAEGSKEKEYRTSSRVAFSNSDPKMIMIFIKWVRQYLDISMEDIYADLYIHESHRYNINNVVSKWSEILGLPVSFIRHTYFKQNKINTKRKNTGALYIGLLRVNIRTSSDLNRKISGWIKGICKNCGIV